MENNWISVKDRLPEIGSMVKCRDENGKEYPIAFVTRKANGEIIIFPPTIKSVNITHWSQLTDSKPSPPKEKQ